MLQSQISMETAKMSMDQGDMKHAVDLYNHADTMAFNERRLKIDQNQWSDKKELEYQKLQIERDTQRDKALYLKTENAKTEAETKIGIPALAARNRAEAGRDPYANALSRETIAERTAKISSANAVLKDILASPAEKKSAREFLASVFNGLEGTKPSIQRPETGINPKDILN